MKFFFFIKEKKIRMVLRCCSVAQELGLYDPRSTESETIGNHSHYRQDACTKENICSKQTYNR